MKSLILYFILQVGDVVSTKIGLDNGMYELNPLGRSQHMILFKLLFTSIFIGIFYYLYKSSPERKSLLDKVSYGICGFYLIIIINNLSFFWR